MQTRILLMLIAATGVAACGGDGGSTPAAQNPPLPLASRAACEAFQGNSNSIAWPHRATVVEVATWHEAEPANATAAATPEHCEISGAIARRTGIDGYPYEIKFRLRMPSEWNGRFFMEGGGGTNGSLSAATGSLGGGQTASALSRNFATIATDGGHDNAVNNNPDALGTVAFGMDPQARIDMGYNSYDQVTQAGKAAVAQFYGRAPDKSYFIGCSEGGREGMMLSQRFPSHYDGIVAGAPGYQLPKAGISGAWTTQSLAPAAVGVDAQNVPLINKAFSDVDLHLLSRGILGTCDALDGLSDGIVNDFRACQAAFDPATALNPDTSQPLQCTGAKTPDCLSAAQVTGIKRAMGGPVDSAGAALYNRWAWDPGMSGLNGTSYNQGWRSWWLGSYASSTNNAQRVNGFSARSWLVDFATPPEPMPVTQVAARMMNFNFDTDPPKIRATSGPFTPSSMEWHGATSTNLAAFRDRGGKLMLYHGMSDAAFSALDTADYYERLGAAMPGAAGFARLFLVPGMNHCSGGPGTDRFDMLTPLVAWVERDKAPDQVSAWAGTPGYFGATARTRPLCPYPQIARYKGSGDINAEASFVCVAP
ncbi:mono(2-hydroxyethyl) terephthalate hydrolase [Comamonas thiooxydans]|uniref:Tannase/feruloyl esterase family alpha/beta hydrolase n=1 Tax=Comamonas thiooxydans TaxID=363952 RepID=A0A0E3BRB7_9BURK|nr:tannase/feruloyl esterase family alpha/beta hydrolase [Comamonas thiooxydans]KGH05124.1 hypothetical protein P608_23495 [Comamonas thiooxydans]KGH18114.1 hypothetical protein P606_25225 [Comamonas thiooxydans]KGH28153.1 hypothetical protein P607_02830 [Comamonas thiooxydans]